MENTTILFIILSVLATLASISLLMGFLRHSRVRKTKRSKKLHRIGLLLIGFSLVAFPIFCILLPLSGFSNAWMIEVTLIEIFVITYYIASLYFRVLQIRNFLQKVTAYIILMSLIAIVYMVIFYLIYHLLFKIADPPAEVFVLNFIMIVIVLLLVPAIWELFSFLRSLSTSSSSDLTYILKKLGKFATNKAKPTEVADFLADYMHLQYIGIFMDGKLYGSKEIDFQDSDLKTISRLKKAEKFWQIVPETAKEKGIFAIAELKNAKGGAYGQVLVGAPNNRMSLDRKDLAQMEMIINIVSAMFDSETKTGYRRKAWRNK